VFVARLIPEEGLQQIVEATEATVWSQDLPPSRDQLLDAVEGCYGVLTLLTDRVDAEFLDRAGPQLKVVSNYAVGFDNVDVVVGDRLGNGEVVVPAMTPKPCVMFAVGESKEVTSSGLALANFREAVSSLAP
jgi:lactate dehydrogenase-like 2-hydroxyacid dehydrogenase